MTEEVTNDEQSIYGNHRRCEVISQSTFHFLKGLKVLELGPQDGSWFTRHLLNYTDDVTVIELNSGVLFYLRNDFPSVKVIEEDFNECLPTVGKYDAVIVYGVLYHSHVPIKMLEDIANFIKPTYVLLENILGKNSGSYAILYVEETNAIGMRQTTKKSTGMVFSLGQAHYDTAMTILGYEKIGDFDVAENEELMKLPGELKKNCYYTVWKLKDNNV